MEDLKESQWNEKTIRAKYPELYKYILEHYTASSFAEKVYLYRHQCQPGVCLTCGKPTKFINKTKGYQQYCCPKCCNANPNKINKQVEAHSKLTDEQKEQINIKRYQTLLSHYTYEEISNKRKQTCLDKYGDENYRNINKSKQTKLERYGDEFFTNRQKAAETVKEKYGCESPFGVKEFQEKTKQTKLERYGDKNYNNIESSKHTKQKRYGDENYNNRDKYTQTLLERYGNVNYNNKEKAQETCLEKYGAKSPMQNDEVKEKSLQNHRQKYLELHDDIVSYTGNGDYIVKCQNPDCNKCDLKTFVINPRVYRDRVRLHLQVCTNLMPEGFHNKNTTPEIFIHNILDKYNIEYIKSDRTILEGKELDIYIPSKHIAIECNGIYWHSTIHCNDNSYHIKKWKECKNKGVQLITIWEDQINNTPNIVESILLNKLGLVSNNIYARQCIIKEVYNKTCKDFLNTNHIQGECNASIRLGLYYNDELVSIMTFSRRRGLMGKGFEDEWELSRFCNKLNTNVIGGASKLFKYFITHYKPTQIYSFSSNDISNGNLYKVLGFNEDRVNSAYWYIDHKTYKRYHRSSYSKSSIVKMGLKEQVDNTWTESEVTYQLGLLKIYDSGQTKWIWAQKEEA